MASLPGLDVAAVEQWLDGARPRLRAGQLQAELIAGGRSNLTYRITDGHQVWALRRPPLAHVLPTAHDMRREYRVISGLAATTVAVPQTVALCEDPSVIGAPFYLMTFVDGVLFDRADRVSALDPTSARRVDELLVETLVELHQIDPEAVGLADFGRPDGFLGRQLRRWKTQWDASVTRELPAMDDVVTALAADLPASGPPGIVHGDYRLTNVLFAEDLSRLSAVLDWEMATLGDPLADVGMLVVYHRLAAGRDDLMPLMRPEQGFLTGDQMAARYCELSHRRLHPWYVAFGYFKLAVIAEGIRARFLQGQTVGAGFERVGDNVPELLHSARQELETRHAGV